ncbi:cold shock domain-containing protein [Vibrio fluvialis]|nr:cold shock domain-containing protein [Vibrio fluvialis]
MRNKNNYTLGTVDWFGGKNKKTGRDNQFGFINTHDFKSVFVHKNEVDGVVLSEGDIVVFELSKDNKSKLSAKNVIKIVNGEKSALEAVIKFTVNSTDLDGVFSRVNYRNIFINILKGDSGEYFIKSVRSKTSLFPFLSKIIKYSGCQDVYFPILIEGLNAQNLYDSKISSEYIPSNYFLENYQRLFDWWVGLKDEKMKLTILNRTANYLSRNKNLYEMFIGSLEEESLYNIIGVVKSEFGIIAPVVNMLSKEPKSSKFLDRYTSDLTVDVIINNDLPIASLSNDFLERIVINKIKDIESEEKYDSLSKSFITMILNGNLLDKVLSGSSEEMQIEIIKSYSELLPYNETVLGLISRDSSDFNLFNVYSKGKSLENYLDNNISSNLLPSDFIKKQLKEHLEKLRKPKKEAEELASKATVVFALSNSSTRLFCINLLKQVHITHYSDIINCLTENDKLVLEYFKNSAVSYPSTPEEIPYLLPLMLLKENDFNNIFFYNNVDSIFSFLESLDEENRKDFFKDNLVYFDTSALLCLVFKELIDVSSLGKRINEVNSFVFDVVFKNSTGVHDYVRSVYKKCFGNVSEFIENTIINPLYIENQLIRKKYNVKVKIYNKEMTFVNDVVSDKDIASDPEFWILSKLLPLVVPENSLETISSAILHEIWSSLLNGELDIDHPSIFKLFPQCNTLRHEYPHIKLSCEAFVWRKESESRFSRPENVYLCRSRRCNDPQVEPDLSKNFEEFTIFDWLCHYGLNYATVNEPSKRDFAIKLAGYLNRIRELHSHLNCRSCGNLMIPNMKYARIEVVKYDPSIGQKIKVPINAAYRLTVFKCNCEDCQEYGISYYINHCIGFKCYEIIDSRDLTERCSEGRYICPNPECRSCCSTHAENSGNFQQQNMREKHFNLYKDSPSFYKDIT